MKKFACLFVGLVCMTGVAFGAGRIGPFASWLTSNDEDAFGGGLKCEWLFNENVGIDARASYLTSDDMYLIPLEIGLIGIMPLEGLSLHAGGGLGYYIPEDVSESFGPYEVEGPDPTFGFYVIAGVRLPMADNVAFFAEAKYTKAESDDESSYRTAKAGMDLDGIGANLGILWEL